ncbi:restriction endonuclease subunit S [Paenibacillus sp. MMS18-CY102]|uniref:restriction endonuclease subunit S n=1 Tax=Paenibacillus sp. MMS18-CY102 TaxID=2682849 RepID=UPI00136677C6|nr:restriction endonuclease subunit S [Paenibacillus sp. MMS18-CY102]MWC27174.1 restriction endonuclease subunit S [Paenibacillus sp. MMS18-CY102]
MLVNQDGKKIKYLSTLINQKANDADNHKIYIGLENVEPKTSRLLINENAPTEVDGQSNLFYKHNVLFGKLRPYLAKGFTADFEGRCSGEFLVLQTSDKISPVFLNYLMLSDHFIDDVNSSTYGAKMPRASWDYIGNIKVDVPTIEIQKSIVDFLNKRTHNIDLLISKKQKLIDLLQEKRQAIIDEVVTKGLDPNAPMKDSGIEGLGTVPAKWEVKIIKRITHEHKQGYYGSDGYVDEGIKLARITDIDDRYNVSFENMPFVNLNKKEEKAFKIDEGDFLFVRSGATIGKFGIVRNPEKSVFASYLIRFKFKNVNTEFLKYALSSSYFRNNLFSTLHGGANTNINAENIKEQIVCLPPIDEQRIINANLDETCNKLNKLIDLTEKQIVKLIEYRQSLISEAVTGIDVIQYGEEVVQ